MHLTCPLKKLRSDGCYQDSLSTKTPNGRDRHFPNMNSVIYSIFLSICTAKVPLSKSEKELPALLEQLKMIKAGCTESGSSRGSAS